MARKINFTTEFRDFNGEPILHRSVNSDDLICPHCGEHIDPRNLGAAYVIKPMTLRQIAVDALTARSKNPDGKESYERFRLAERISNRDEIELTDAEVVKLKKLIGESFAPLIVGRSYDILEPELDSE